MTPIPCPLCGIRAYSWGPDGQPQRRCWGCSHVWTPGDAVPSPATSAAARPALKRSGGVEEPAAPASPVDSQPVATRDAGGEGGRAPRAFDSRPSPTIGVLVPAGIKTLAGSTMLPVRELPWLLEGAERAGIRQLWIGPHMTAQLELDVVALVDGRDYRGPVRLPGGQAWLGAALRAGWTRAVADQEVRAIADQGLAPWVELRRGETRLELAFPGWDPEGNPFAGARTPTELLEALELFAGHLRLRYRWSPGATGLALMRAVHSGRGGLKLPEVGTPAPPAVDGYDSMVPAGFMVDELPAGGWLHAFDINGMFLAACSSAELGFGEPVHRSQKGAPAEAEFSDHAGYWRAKVATPKHTGGMPFKADGKPHWYTAPALELIQEWGGRIEVLEAWIYPEKHRWLEPWYARLRDARTALAATEGPAGVLALGAVKKVYAASLGRLAGSWMKVGDAAFRPDWRHVVIDRARANMHRHLRKVGRPPVALDADLAVWSCSSSDPIAAAKELGLEVSSQLGKWKHEGAVDVERARAAIAGAGTSKLKRRRALLDLLEASLGPV